MDEDERLRDLAAASDEWEALAIFAKDRRLYLGWDQEDVANYGGPGKTTVGKIESGREKVYSAKTLQQMERVYGWPRGFIRSLKSYLSGPDRDLWDDEVTRGSMYGEMVEAADPDLLSIPDSQVADGASLATASDAALLAEIARRFERAKEKASEQRDAAPNRQAGESPADSEPPRKPARRATARATRSGAPSETAPHRSAEFGGQ